MRYSKTDLVPNLPMKSDQVVAGCASDARWRAIEVDNIDSPRAHEVERERFERVRWGRSEQSNETCIVQAAMQGKVV